MEKQSKFFMRMGVLLRAHISGPSHLSPFCQRGLDVLVSPQKDICAGLAGFELFFHNVQLHYLQHISKNGRPILPCSYFWTFAHCG